MNLQVLHSPCFLPHAIITMMMTVVVVITMMLPITLAAAETADSEGRPALSGADQDLSSDRPSPGWREQAPELWNLADRVEGAPGQVCSRGNPEGPVSVKPEDQTDRTVGGARESLERRGAFDLLLRKLSASDLAALKNTQNPLRLFGQVNNRYLNVGAGTCGKARIARHNNINDNNRLNENSAALSDGDLSRYISKTATGNPNSTTVSVTKAEPEVGVVGNRAKRLRDVEDDYRRILRMLSERRRAMEMRKLTEMLMDLMRRNPASPR